MFFWFRSILLAGLVCYGHSAMATPGTALDWVDLPDPSVQVYEDPYRDLSPEQFDDVLFVVRMRGRLQQDAGSAEERQIWQELLTETEDALAGVGVDVDWLLDQREFVRRGVASGSQTVDSQLE